VGVLVVERDAGGLVEGDGLADLLAGVCRVVALVDRGAVGEADASDVLLRWRNDVGIQAVRRAPGVTDR
jgi:hypothetical protein